VLRGELEDGGVLAPPAAEPHPIVFVDEDAVLELGPLVAGPRPAPRREQIAVLIELEDRRCGAPERSRLVRLQRRRSMDDPDVIPSVDGDADDCADPPRLRKGP